MSRSSAPPGRAGPAHASGVGRANPTFVRGAGAVVVFARLARVNPTSTSGGRTVVVFARHCPSAAPDVPAADSLVLGPVAKPISFARGAPSLDIIDVDGLKAAAEQAFASDPGGVTAYGTAIGYPPLRRWIAEYHQVEPEQVMVTNGSMQADAFLFEALVEPGNAVIVERPTYDRTLLSLRNRGADVRPVELEADGIDVAALERVLAARLHAV
jgi:DNA-binding transcriptional MocR family regulator